MTAARLLLLSALLSLATPLHAAEVLATGLSDPDDDDVELLAKELAEELVLKEETEDEISIDADSSLDVTVQEQGRVGWFTFADVRGRANRDYLEARDGETIDESDVAVRFRVGANRAFTDSFRVAGRLAVSCASDSCKREVDLEEDTQGGSDRLVEIDEAFIHWYQGERFDLALGRMQTKFITKGGVFAKSLDRNDSNNTRITWTDAVHGTLHLENGWEPHLILQYNPKNGPAQVLRDPLDFSSDKSRASLFLSFVNEKPVRYLTQRAIDISYYPSALLKDGYIEGGRREDYWGIVARAAGRYPKRSSGTRIRFSAEVGYAPETPSKAGVSLAGDGNTDGVAFALTLSLMDLFPKHSIGLNFARTDAGWLLSPQYNKNERLVELRYIWVVTERITFDVRIRRRKELDQLTDAVQRSVETDAFARFTMRFRKNE